jgi:VanZ family protein
VTQALRPLALVALLLFLVLANTPDRTRFWTTLYDFGHAPLCGLFALIIRSAVASGGRREPRASLYAFAFTAALGFLTEAVQVFQTTRDASLEDLARDAAGAAAFLLAAAAVRNFAAMRKGVAGPSSRRRGVLGLVLASALMAASAAEFTRTLALYMERARAFPTLYALDGSWWEEELIRGQNSRLTYGQTVPRGEGEGRMARLDLRPGLYPGLTFDEPYPDWRGWNELVLTIYSDLESPLPIVIRIHDAAHDQSHSDRFNKRLMVRPGRNTFVIALDEVRDAPRRREMDLRRIRAIIVFSHKLEGRAHLYLGPLRLR